VNAVIDNLPRFIEAFGMTLWLLVLSGACALIIGTVIAAMRISPVPSLSAFASVYTELLRNTPLTLVLFFCAFVLPQLGSRLPYEWAAFIGLTLYTSPFVAEALRSGINGVAVGQAEAARSLGLGFMQSTTLVIAPACASSMVATSSPRIAGLTRAVRAVIAAASPKPLMTTVAPAPASAFA
jgi:glutamate transport system permease protein